MTLLEEAMAQGTSREDMSKDEWALYHEMVKDDVRSGRYKDSGAQKNWDTYLKENIPARKHNVLTKLWNLSGSPYTTVKADTPRAYYKEGEWDTPDSLFVGTGLDDTMQELSHGFALNQPGYSRAAEKVGYEMPAEYVKEHQGWGNWPAPAYDKEMRAARNEAGEKDYYTGEGLEVPGLLQYMLGDKEKGWYYPQVFDNPVVYEPGTEDGGAAKLYFENLDRYHQRGTQEFEAHQIIAPLLYGSYDDAEE